MQTKTKDQAAAKEPGKAPLGWLRSRLLETVLLVAVGCGLLEMQRQGRYAETSLKAHFRVTEGHHRLAERLRGQKRVGIYSEAPGSTKTKSYFPAQFCWAPTAILGIDAKRGARGIAETLAMGVPVVIDHMPPKRRAEILQTLESLGSSLESQSVNQRFLLLMPGASKP